MQKAIIEDDRIKLTIRFKGHPIGWPDMTYVFETFKHAILGLGFSERSFQNTVDYLANDIWEEKEGPVEEVTTSPENGGST
jgi:hypothetical protein